MDSTLEPTMLSVEEAARVAKISRRHAYHLVATGEIPSVRLGKVIRVSSRRLLEMLEDNAGTASERNRMGG